MALSLKAGKALDERWHLRRDGSCIWESGLMMPLRDADGRLIDCSKIMRDRTAERARVEEQLRHPEEGVVRRVDRRAMAWGDCG